MSDGLSPGMRQYLAAKRQHPDALLLCRMGDFYETFGADAETVARELDIVLTSRGTDADGNRIPLAGVPYHAAESYIARLVRKGYRVAIAEQMEDPKKAKGIVKREVVRVVTPGTLVDGAMLEAPQARYLMAVAPGPERTGIAVLDASTGEFAASSVSNAEARAAVLAEAVRRSPEEVLIPETLDGPRPRGRGVARDRGHPPSGRSVRERGRRALPRRPVRPQLRERRPRGRRGRRRRARLRRGDAPCAAPAGGRPLARRGRRGPARPRRDHGPEPRAGPARSRRKEGRDPARGARPDGHVHGRPPPPRPDRPPARGPGRDQPPARRGRVLRSEHGRAAGPPPPPRRGRRPRADRRPHRLRQRLAARPRRPPAIARGPARSCGASRLRRRPPGASRRGRGRARRPCGRGRARRRCTRRRAPGSHPERRHDPRRVRPRARPSPWPRHDRPRLGGRTPAGRARADGDPDPEDRVQPRLRLLHRGPEVAGGPRPARVRAAADDRDRRALHRARSPREGGRDRQRGRPAGRARAGGLAGADRGPPPGRAAAPGRRAGRGPPRPLRRSRRGRGRAPLHPARRHGRDRDPDPRRPAPGGRGPCRASRSCRTIPSSTPAASSS